MMKRLPLATFLCLTLLLPMPACQVATQKARTNQVDSFFTHDEGETGLTRFQKRRILQKSGRGGRGGAGAGSGGGG